VSCDYKFTSKMLYNQLILWRELHAKTVKLRGLKKDLLNQVVGFIREHEKEEGREREEGGGRERERGGGRKRGGGETKENNNNNNKKEKEKLREIEGV